MSWRYHSYSYECIKEQLSNLYQKLLPKYSRTISSKAAKKDNCIFNMITINNRECIITIVYFDDVTQKDKVTMYLAKTNSKYWSFESLSSLQQLAFPRLHIPKDADPVNYFSYGLEYVKEIFEIRV
jgi:hypothetical protein